MSATIPPNCAYRIKHDMKEIMKSPPLEMHGVPDDDDFLLFHAIITGVDDTPYEKGFFYFVLRFPTDYPLTPPKVTFMTTGGGLVRMNPNLYACGKVCLSILGTWPGPSWSPAQSLTSLFISIQSLLNEFPYYNEPCVARNGANAEQYNKIILHETLRIAVISMVRNDFHLSMPMTLQLHIQQQFVQNINYYENLATKNMALTGNIMVDPLYGEIGTSFEYAKLYEDIQEIKKQLRIDV